MALNFRDSRVPRVSGLLKSRIMFNERGRGDPQVEFKVLNVVEVLVASSCTAVRVRANRTRQVVINQATRLLFLIAVFVHHEAGSRGVVVSGCASFVDYDWKDVKSEGAEHVGSLGVQCKGRVEEQLLECCP